MCVWIRERQRRGATVGKFAWHCQGPTRARRIRDQGRRGCAVGVAATAVTICSRFVDRMLSTVVLVWSGSRVLTGRSARTAELAQRHEQGEEYGH